MKGVTPSSRFSDPFRTSGGVDSSGPSEEFRPVPDGHHFDQVTDGDHASDLLAIRHDQVADVMLGHDLAGIANRPIEIDIEEGEAQQ